MRFLSVAAMSLLPTLLLAAVPQSLVVLCTPPSGVAHLELAHGGHHDDHGAGDAHEHSAETSPDHEHCSDQTLSIQPVLRDGLVVATPAVATVASIARISTFDVLPRPVTPARPTTALWLANVTLRI